MVLQLAMEKMYASEVTVTDVEAGDYIKTNKATLSSTDPAKMKQEAEDALRRQKLQMVLGDKFAKLKDAAKIKIF